MADNMNTKQPLICIGREYGSGGREIAEKLAEKLGLPCYDKLLIHKAAEKSGYTEHFLTQNEEQPFSIGSLLTGNPFADTVSMAHAFYPESQMAFDAERHAIQDIAQNGGGVFVGRCASSILADHKDMLSVFIYANEDSKIKRVMARNQTDEITAKKRIQKVDRMRKRYFDFYADTHWGESESYDMMLSSSQFGIDGCVELILQCLELRNKHAKQ